MGILFRTQLVHYWNSSGVAVGSRLPPRIRAFRSGANGISKSVLVTFVRQSPHLIVKRVHFKDKKSIPCRKNAPFCRRFPSLHIQRDTKQTQRDTQRTARDPREPRGTKDRQTIKVPNGWAASTHDTGASGRSAAVTLAPRLSSRRARRQWRRPRSRRQWAHRHAPHTRSRASRP